MGRATDDDGFGSSSRGGGAADRSEMELQPSKWFLESDYVDTGLETAFASVFSLEDTPREVRTPDKKGFLGGLFGRS